MYFFSPPEHALWIIIRATVVENVPYDVCLVKTDQPIHSQSWNSGDNQGCAD